MFGGTTQGLVPQGFEFKPTCALMNTQFVVFFKSLYKKESVVESRCCVFRIVTLDVMI